AVVRIEDLHLVRECELREARDAGSHAQDGLELSSAQLHEARILRPGPDEAHLAAQDVPELRDLVELRLREEGPDPRETIVVDRREGRPRGAGLHLPELEHRELAAEDSDPPAAVEDRPAAVEL